MAAKIVLEELDGLDAVDDLDDVDDGSAGTLTAPRAPADVQNDLLPGSADGAPEPPCVPC